MAMSNASLLDEATAAAEAMSMCYSLKNQKRKKFFVSADANPQNIGTPPPSLPPSLPLSSTCIILTLIITPSLPPSRPPPNSRQAHRARDRGGGSPHGRFHLYEFCGAILTPPSLPPSLPSGLLQTRGKPIGLEIVVGDHRTVDFTAKEFCGALIQYPNTYGRVRKGGREGGRDGWKRRKGGREGGTGGR